jgi:hypothetical protein
LPEWDELFDTHAALIYVGWFIFQLVLSLLPTGTVAYGLPLVSGKKLAYRCNGKHGCKGISIMIVTFSQVLT